MPQKMYRKQNEYVKTVSKMGQHKHGQYNSRICWLKTINYSYHKNHNWYHGHRGRDGKVQLPMQSVPITTKYYHEN